MTLHGIDVASYQGAHPDYWGSAIVAIKVSQGTGYVNPDWQSQLADARKLGCRIVFYHYPVIAESVSSQVGHFLGTIAQELIDNDVTCLDWEWYDQTGVSDQQARDFKDLWFTTIKNLKLNKAILYSDVHNWINVDVNSNCGDGLWIADYGAQAGNPRIKHPWIAHQYSDTPVDEDEWNFQSVVEFDQWARENSVVATPINTPIDVRTESGFGVWNYKNPDPGDDAWTKLCEIQAQVKANGELLSKIALHLGV